MDYVFVDDVWTSARRNLIWCSRVARRVDECCLSVIRTNRLWRSQVLTRTRSGTSKRAPLPADCHFRFAAAAAQPYRHCTDARATHSSTTGCAPWEHQRNSRKRVGCAHPNRRPDPVSHDRAAGGLVYQTNPKWHSRPCARCGRVCQPDCDCAAYCAESGFDYQAFEAQLNAYENQQRIYLAGTSQQRRPDAIAQR